MASTIRSVSPGGALLRASRMFSLPEPIAPASDHIQSKGYTSTSTIPFPTHQAITTLNSSRARGDWGLKRPLPLKSTTGSSNPMLRVKQVDSVEHVTDFTSAADHGLTLRKFQEMHLPITPPRIPDGSRSLDISPSRTPARSVFEDDLDCTALDKDERINKVDDRWRFQGPYLSTMLKGEFDTWLAKAVRPKRPQFRNFLKQALAKEMNANAAAEAADKGEEAPAQLRASDITDEQFVSYLRRLRNNNAELFSLVGQFLDLPPLPPPKVPHQLTKNLNTVIEKVKSPYAHNGPPITHPSAGLGYLRTSMYMDNHPIYGPQKHHPPVVARVLRIGRGIQDARIGVGGFVTAAPPADSYYNQQKALQPSPLFNFDATSETGAKMWAAPAAMSITQTGRARLIVGDADLEATEVARELLGDPSAQILGRKPEEPRKKQRFNAGAIRNRYTKEARLAGAQDYGLGL